MTLLSRSLNASQHGQYSPFLSHGIVRERLLQRKCQYQEARLSLKSFVAFPISQFSQFQGSEIPNVSRVIKQFVNTTRYVVKLP
jgi:hypothetical protein